MIAVKKRDARLAARGITNVEQQIQAENEHNKLLQQKNEEEMVS